MNRKMGKSLRNGRERIGNRKEWKGIFEGMRIVGFRGIWRVVDRVWKWLRYKVFGVFEKIGLE